MTITLSGMTVYAENNIIPHAEVTFEKNEIKKIAKQAIQKSIDENHFVFPENYSLVPGFIDLHVHGVKGADFLDGTEQSFKTISTALAEEGTTSFLATTMTASVTDIEKTLVTAKNFMHDNTHNAATCLGVHLEGPFISPEKLGAQLGDNILNPDISLVKKWQHISNNIIKLITLAPELPNANELINFLLTENIIPSIGHSNASYEIARDAINAGCKHATHIFNGMNAIHQRAPGAVTAALLAENLFAEMIVDGVHLHPAIVELLVKVKGVDKLLLVTDAIRGKCLCDGKYDLGGQQVHVRKNQARLQNGSLAGSLLKMSDAIKNVMRFSNCSLQDAIKMAAENPARALNIFHQKGSVAVGKEADLVVLDQSCNVVMTICQGSIAYSTNCAQTQSEKM